MTVPEKVSVLHMLTHTSHRFLPQPSDTSYRVSGTSVGDHWDVGKGLLNLNIHIK